MSARFAALHTARGWFATVATDEGRAWNGTGDTRFAAVLDMCDAVAWDAQHGRIPGDLQDAVFSDVLDAIESEVAS